MTQGVWRATVLAALVLAVVAVNSVAGSPQEETDKSKDPIFNIWEFAISQRNYNPRRSRPKVKDPCTWAIVRCCPVHDRGERDFCFSQNHCAGAWFENLCSDRFRKLARKEVQSSFGSFGSGF